MNKEEIRQALVKFDREDLLFGNNDIYLDDNVEVFLTISQMIKFNNQQKKIDQLTNNWNELEDIIDNEVNYYIEDEDAEWFEAKKIQNIMKEIKEGKNDIS